MQRINLGQMARSAASGRRCAHPCYAVSGVIVSVDFKPDDSFFDRLLIREVIENWAVWRDAGDWERFRTVWHDDGFMMATWFQGSADEFIRVSKEGFERGVSILHFLGGCSIDVFGERAIAQTKMT